MGRLTKFLKKGGPYQECNICLDNKYPLIEKSCRCSFCICKKCLQTYIDDGCPHCKQKMMVGETVGCATKGNAAMSSNNKQTSNEASTALFSQDVPPEPSAPPPQQQVPSTGQFVSAAEASLVASMRREEIIRHFHNEVAERAIAEGKKKVEDAMKTGNMSVWYSLLFDPPSIYDERTDFKIFESTMMDFFAKYGYSKIKIFWYGRCSNNLNISFCF